MANIVKNLDFDEISVVKEVCEAYKNFVDWNKGYFIYEIFDPKVPLDAIYIAHNLWDKGELSTAENFFNELDEVLNEYLHLHLYSGSEKEQWKDIVKFFAKFL